MAAPHTSTYSGSGTLLGPDFLHSERLRATSEVLRDGESTEYCNQNGQKILEADASAVWDHYALLGVRAPRPHVF